MCPPLQCVWSFGEGCALPPLDRNLLGGKGKGEVEMVAMGLPVPPGFIISTEACVEYRARKLPPASMFAEIQSAIKVLEKQTNTKFGDPKNPLLISVRSGARVSMPGMMETILDLGLNDEVVKGFAVKMGSEKVAYDSFRRFIQMYANVVANVDNSLFEAVLSSLRASEEVSADMQLSGAALQSACRQFQRIYADQTNCDFPTDPTQQLTDAVLAVFRSWDCPKAVAYRRFHGYSDSWGTAVVVMLMVFGNRGDGSGSGVGFTRDPATGEANFYGEYLLNCQGEDVVAGIRTPLPVNRFQANLQGRSVMSLEDTMPQIYQQLIACGKTLETHFHDMQDVEFTIEDGKLFMLQTRTGKRTGFAAIRIACEMLREGLVDEQTALLHVEPEHLSHVLNPVFDIREKTSATSHLVARGLNAAPGAASGAAAFSSKKAVEFKSKGIACVLLREETSPEDFAGMVASAGILTLRGGATSHAAVVARGLGKACVCGCSDVHFHTTPHHTPTTTADKTTDHVNNNSVENNKRVDNSHNNSDNSDNSDRAYVEVRGRRLYEGDSVSIDGTTGQVYFCHLPTRPSQIYQVLVEKSETAADSAVYRDYSTLVGLADKYKSMKVYANVDTATDATIARAFGAEGVGLCRTEHMFMDPGRLGDVREMLFCQDVKQKEIAVQRLLPFQKNDFIGIFKAMDSCNVTIRLLDPPRHEFLPHTASDYAALAERIGVGEEQVRELAAHVKESNPMLGHRGCRLGITNPFLTAMQTRAILEAAAEVQQQSASDGVKSLKPQIMVPLVMCGRELQHQVAVIRQTAAEVLAATGVAVDFKVGTMIELPRACLRAADLAVHADFFSFGTNDLTQCTLGISRDDAGSFLPAYIRGVEMPPSQTKVQIVETDPFTTLDQGGVCELMSLAVERGTAANPALEVGICGEHGGEGRSVRMCHDMHLHYVSCSPFRIGVAKLAAAQAHILEMKEKKLLVTNGGGGGV
eukprot:GHVS01041749.1.p1 GENE.GHVS01041749.1~~GHVS01041749.1.p1  ORF type:complete len:979 (-),score=210.87 GHVS01041749.1:96-3032(-)